MSYHTTLRELHKGDMHSLLRIENNVQICPWNRETFNMCFEAGYLGWAILKDETMLGFVMIAIDTNEYCHVLNLCVDIPYQRQGWGRKLLQVALTYAKANSMEMAYLEVRYSNNKAIKLYQSMQFQQVGERKNYYPTVSGNEDALIFAKNLKEYASMTTEK